MKNAHLVIVAVAAILSVIIFAAGLRWDALVMSVSLQNSASLLAPIAFAAAVVERGVEVMISPWRDTEAAKLEKALATAQAGTDPNAVQRVSDRLDDYRGATQHYAFAVSLILSLLLSIAGIRALQPFLDSARFVALNKDNPQQHEFFLCIDVVLTAFVLAGGATGVHSVVNAITAFFDSTAAKARA